MCVLKTAGLPFPRTAIVLAEQDRRRLYRLSCSQLSLKVKLLHLNKQQQSDAQQHHVPSKSIRSSQPSI